MGLIRYTLPPEVAGVGTVIPETGQQTIFTETFPDTNWISRYQDDTATPAPPNGGGMTLTVGTPLALTGQSIPGYSGNAMRVQWLNGNAGGSLIRFLNPTGYIHTMLWEAYYFLPTGFNGNVRLLTVLGSREDNDYSAITNSAAIVADGLNMFNVNIEKVAATTNFYIKAQNAQTNQVSEPSFFVDGTGDPNCSYPNGRIGITLNQWVRVGVEVCLNVPGSSNGWMRYYLNSAPISEWRNLNLRASGAPTTGLRLNGIGFQMFSSGGPATNQQYYIANARCVVDYDRPAGTPAPGFPVAAQTFTPATIKTVALNATGTASGYWNGLQDYPNGFIEHDPTGGVLGTGCTVANIPGGTGFFPNAAVNYPRRGDVFYRTSLRCASPSQVPSGNMKGPIYFHDSAGAGNSGFIYSNLGWGFAFEGEAITFTNGLSWGAVNPDDLNFGTIPTAINIADNLWHNFEVRYNRTNSPVYAQIWIDGVPVILPPGNANWNGNGYAGVQFVGGSVELDEPSRIQATRSAQGGAFHDYVSFFETMSQATPGVVRQDNIHVSAERIGTGNRLGVAPIYETWTNPGAALPVQLYSNARWVYSSPGSSGSDLVIRAGGGFLECTGPVPNTNAHVRCTAGGLYTSNYDVLADIRYRTNPNCLSEVYIYMNGDDGYFTAISGGSLTIYRYQGGTPTVIGSPVALSGLVDGRWYRVRFGKSGNTLTSRLYHVDGPSNNRFPVVATATDSTFTSGTIGAGVFCGPGGVSVGVGRITQTETYGT